MRARVEGRPAGCNPANLSTGGRPLERIDGLGYVRHSLSAPALSLEEEIRRYLSAVDVFRAEGAAPTWRADHV